jgi:ABC-type uncharacterized transport system YnjBCD substrate-binding protein
MPDMGIFIALGGAFSTLAAGFWAWLTQRQNAAERLMNTTFANASQTIESQGERILLLEGRIQELSMQVSGMITENARVVAQNVRLEGELASAKIMISSLETEVLQLKSAKLHTTMTSITTIEEPR